LYYFATYSVNANFRDCLHVDYMKLILYFRAILGLSHTHALCMTQNVVRYVKMLPGLVILETDPPESDIRTVGVVMGVATV